MQRSLRATSPKLVLVACIATVSALVGCSQFVDFDRSQIPDQNGKDGGRPSDGGTGGMDAGKDAGPTPMDASMDATMSLPDGNMSMEGGREGGTGCNPADHAGCAADQLCCDTDTDGSFECVTTSPTQCESCGTACDTDVADVCTDRSCGCGAGSTTECEGDTPVCEPDQSLCVECRDSNDCTGNPNGEFCFLPGVTATAQDNTCVECDPATHAGCEGTKPWCNATGACEACTTAGNKCPGSQTCLSTGACECSSSSECTSSTAPICDGSTKQCRGCNAVGECTAIGKTYCVGNESCTDCLPTTEAGCSGTTPDCRLNGASVYQCLGCTTNAHCANLGVTDVCNTGTGSCVECVGDNDCSGATPLCNANVCVACDSSAITATAAARDNRCDAKSALNTIACATSGAKKGECTACDPADHGGCADDRLCCEGTGGVPSCEATAFGTQCAACDTACSGLNVNACNGHTCGCGAGAACSGTTDICNGGTCVDCTASGGCTGDTLCKTTTNVCVECLVNADCREVGDDPAQTFCAANNTCVSCLDSADCTNAATPICNGSGVCVACNAGGISATACDDKTDGTVCVTGGGSGSVAGSCGACNPDTDLGCSGAPVLDQCEPGAVPACVDCDASGGCTGDTVCKTVTNACVECLVNADCREAGDDPAQTFCDTGSNTCVGCLDSNDCTTPATPICSAAKECVACTAGGLSPTACDDKTDGTVCVTGGLGSTAGSCGACDPADDDGCSPSGLDECKAGATPVCVDCVEQSDCTGNLACVSNECQACTVPADCANHPTGTKCVNTGTSNECRQCDPTNGNADCGGGTPTCNPASFACE